MSVQEFEPFPGPSQGSVLILSLFGGLAPFGLSPTTGGVYVDVCRPWKAEGIAVFHIPREAHATPAEIEALKEGECWYNVPLTADLIAELKQRLLKVQAGADPNEGVQPLPRKNALLSELRIAQHQSES